MANDSENVQYLTVDLHSVCDSDFEIINHTGEEDNRAGYSRLNAKEEPIYTIETDVKEITSGSQELDTILKNKRSDKIVLSLSQEQIYLLTHHQRHNGTDSLDTIKKSRSSSFSNTFSVVPIQIQDTNQITTKPHLPEIVLTSFENGSSSDENNKKKAETGETVVKSVGSLRKDLTHPGEAARKASYASSHSNQSFGRHDVLFGVETERTDRVHSLNLNKTLSSPYRMSFAMDNHRSSESGLGICQTDLDHIKHPEIGLDSIPAELRCRLCDNIYKDPRTLNCLHSFCLHCLIPENFGHDATIPFWSDPGGINYEWRGNSDSYPTSNSSSNHDSDSPIPLRSESRESAASSKKTEKSSKSNKKSSRSDSVVVNRSEAVEKLKILTCSTCKHCTEMPLGGIIQLPQNYILVRKIENFIIWVREKGLSSIWCNLCCDNITATHHCTTCSINLCGFCKEAHERQRPTAHHNIANILELCKNKGGNDHSADTLKPHLKCSMHPGFELKLFCITCQQIICSDCHILLHKGHKVDTLRKVIRTYQKLLKESVDKTRPLCEYATHAISKLAAITKKINEKCDQVQQQVELHMAAYVEALEVHKSTLLQQISRARETKMQMILEQQSDFEKRSSQADAVVQFTNELTAVGGDAEILSFVNILMKRFEFCYKCKPLLDSKISDTLHFLPEVRAPSTKAQNNIPMFGIITTQTVEPSFCTLETEGYDQLRVHRKAELVILSRDSDGMPLCHGGLNINAVLKYKDSSARSLPFQISDRRDGAYVISFIPDTTGFLVLSVMIKSKHIKGSPFSLRAKSLRPHSGIFHCCAFCSSKGSKTVTCACEGAMPGFKGCGHGHPGHPGRRHWSCCASVLENSECSSANSLIN